MCSCGSVAKQKVFFIIATVLLIVGVFLITFWTGIAKDIVTGRLPLTPTSYTFSKWQYLPIPVYLHVHLYNWTNPHEVRNRDVKANFVELGPYVFREHKVKEDIVWNENKTVTFYSNRTWYFEEKMSNGSLTDLVTLPHFPSVTAAHLVRNMKGYVKKVVDFALKTEGGMLFTTQKALDWIFKGFYDDFMDFGMRFHSPLLHTESEFAIFYQRNGSKVAEGTYTMQTGQKGDLSQLGELTHWRGNNHTGFYKGECGKVNGSTGDLWVPGRSRSESVSVFMSDAGRFINLFPGEDVIVNGIKGIKYRATQQTFDSGELYEDAKCFCPSRRAGSSTCPKNGAIDFSPVANRTPMYLSQRQFYMADPSYLEQTTGLEPGAERHEMYAIIEPILGVPLDINGQVMISLHFRRDDAFELFAGVNEFYAPLFTIGFKATIDKHLTRTVKLGLSLPAIGLYIGYGLISIGLILVVVGFTLTKMKKSRGSK